MPAGNTVDWVIQNANDGSSYMNGNRVDDPAIKRFCQRFYIRYSADYQSKDAIQIY